MKNNDKHFWFFIIPAAGWLYGLGTLSLAYLVQLIAGQELGGTCIGVVTAGASVGGILTAMDYLGRIDP